MIVTHKHMRCMKFCNQGARPFFERHGLDWYDFVQNGIDESILIATGDAMALQVVEYARSVEGEEE